MASSIGFRSSRVNLTDIPGDLAFAFETLGLPAFLVINN
jgi:hypothetical protein